MKIIKNYVKCRGYKGRIIEIQPLNDDGCFFDLISDNRANKQNEYNLIIYNAKKGAEIKLERVTQGEVQVFRK